MGNVELKNSKKKYFSENDKFHSKKATAEFGAIEDKNDLSLIEKIAAEGTKKGFERAKRVSSEILIVRNGKLIRKRPGKPNQIISEQEERKVEIGKTISYNSEINAK